MRLPIALLAVMAANAGVVTSLPSAPPPTFPWSDVFPGTRIGGITVQHYLDVNGNVLNPGSGIGTYAIPIFDNDPDSAEAPIERIGDMYFQYVLWSGSTLGAGGPTNRVGAAMMGGFYLMDTEDVFTPFSFLQIFTDTRHPNGAVDDGGPPTDPVGRTNTQVPGYQPNPALNGWNYAGTDYDYADVPADRVGIDPPETVSFDTCLVCWYDHTAIILASFAWSYTWTNNGGAIGVTGTPPSVTGTGSTLSLYRAAFGGQGYTYIDLGDGSCHALPEPRAVIPLIAAFALLVRRRLLG